LPLAVGPAMSASLGLSLGRSPGLSEVPLFIATLVAADTLSEGQVSTALDALRDAGCGPAGSEWLDRGEAADLRFANDPAAARGALEALFAGVDALVQSEAGRERRLLVADMDSTMITVECIDELADYAGCKAEVADVTERAMRGQLDFADALDARVALLAGLEADAVDRCLAERVRITPGAEALVRTMRARGGRCVLVSGGFTRFAEPVGRAIGFDRVVANVLVEEHGRLTGAVRRPIVAAGTKEQVLAEEAETLGGGTDAVLAVGDGANDLPMIRRAGLGVAFRAKPVVAEAADARVEACGLTALLHAQGIARRHWAEA